MLMTPGLAIAVNSLQVWTGQIFTFEVDIEINLNKLFTYKTTKWFLWGYSLSFSATGSKFIGNFGNKHKFKKLSY